MRILISAAAARTGGGERRIRQLASLPRLAPQHDFLFVVHPSIRATIDRLAPEIDVVSPNPVFRASPLRLAWELVRLPRSLQRFQPDLVLAPYNVAPLHWPFPRPRLVAIVSNLAPYSREVCSLYRGPGRLRLILLRLLTDITLTKADVVFVLSRQALDLLDQARLKRKTTILPIDPPPPSKHKPIVASDGTEPHFVVVSDLLRFKGLEAVIKSLAAIPQSDRVQVLVCGRPIDHRYAKKLRSLIDTLAVGEWCVFLGAVPHDEVMQLLNTARGCIVPSRFENPGRVPLEAMSVGTPLLVNDIDVFRDTCGDAALYFRLDDPRELASHMIALAHDDELYEEAAHASIARLQEVTGDSALPILIRAIDSIDRIQRDTQ